MIENSGLKEIKISLSAEHFDRLDRAFKHYGISYSEAISELLDGVCVSEDELFELNNKVATKIRELSKTAC